MKGYLKLKSGETFTGKCSAHFEDCTGEVVFFTGMTGYQEVISDPSFKGQIVVFTYPFIGHYGINAYNFESTKPQVSGIVVSELSLASDHYQSVRSLKEELEKWEIPVLEDVDTRKVVQTIRTVGDTPGVITMSPQTQVTDAKSMNLVANAAENQVHIHGSGTLHIVLVDFGYKKSILSSLIELGCKVTTVPWNTDVSFINSLNPDGILLSNGPGDPRQLTPHLNRIKQLAMEYPILGICLGHQLLGLAFGGSTSKLLFGHRGANQPVQDIRTGTVGMTAQNHSYVVTEDSLAGTPFEVRYVNVNDGSVEGMVHRDKPITAVQFHPEGHPGPDDFEWIFSDFVNLVRNWKGANVYA